MYLILSFLRTIEEDSSAMKYFSVILCLFLYYELSTQDPMRPFHGGKRSKEFFNECRERTGLSYEELKEFRRSDEARAKLLNDEGNSKTIKCFMACMYEKYGLMEGNTFVRNEPPYDDNDVQENSSKYERRMHFLEARNACMDSAEGAGDQCDVAFAFEVCMESSRPTPPPVA